MLSWPAASGDSGKGVSGILFCGIYLPFTTQGRPGKSTKMARKGHFSSSLDGEAFKACQNRNPGPASALTVFIGANDALRAVFQRGQTEQGLSDRGRCLEGRAEERHASKERRLMKSEGETGGSSISGIQRYAGSGSITVIAALENRPGSW